MPPGRKTRMENMLWGFCMSPAVCFICLTWAVFSLHIWWRTPGPCDPQPPEPQRSRQSVYHGRVNLSTRPDQITIACFGGCVGGCVRASLWIIQEELCLLLTGQKSTFRGERERHVDSAMDSASWRNARLAGQPASLCLMTQKARHLSRPQIPFACFPSVPGNIF